jgi:uncharacterized protein (TIGR02452 family)
VEIANRDCVEVAIDAQQDGMHPLLLNMCSWTRPGGGVESGAGAQEEELFRRSNYFKHLDRRHYPLTTFRTILSRGVEFYRNSRNFQYAPMKRTYHIDCVAAPAPKKPVLTNGRFSAGDAAVLRKKIDLLCQIALKNGNDCLVLSAWGCGAYGCPPEHVAEIFRDAISEYNGLFKKIVFAILDGGCTTGIQTDNFRLFDRVFRSSPLN